MAEIKKESGAEIPTQMVEIKEESGAENPYDSISNGGDRIVARVRSLEQENTFLKSEVVTLKSQQNYLTSECKNLKEECEELRDCVKMVIKQSGLEKPKRVGDFPFTNFKLSPQLAALLGEKTMSRFQVVKKMWAIFKERGLQDPADKRYIRIVDADLKKVFTEVEGGRLMGFGLLKHLKAHMTTM